MELKLKMLTSQFGSKGQYQPFIILILLLTISFSIVHFSLRSNKEMGAEKQNYRSFYTKRVFHTTMRKKVEYNETNYTLLQLAGEALCPRPEEGSCSKYQTNFTNKTKEALNETLKEKYNYYILGNSTDSSIACDFKFPEKNKTYLERASIVRFEGMGYEGCNFTIMFGIWEKESP